MTPVETRREELSFIRELATEAGQPVLELGCGTAQVALSLAEIGIAVTALDNSEDMLAIARSKLAMRSPATQSRLHLILEDMTEFQFDRPYRLVLLPNRVLSYVTNERDRMNFLKKIRDMLEPGGSIFIEEDLFLPPRLLEAWQRRSFLQPQNRGINPATGLATAAYWTTLDLDFFTQTLRGRMLVQETGPGGHLNEYSDTPEITEVHLFTGLELRTAIRAAGFEIRGEWGTYHRSALGVSDRKMMFIANK